MAANYALPLSAHIDCSRLQGLAYKMDNMNDYGYTAHGATELGRIQSPADDDQFVAALTSGGDSRLAVDRRTRANKYLCPPTPVPAFICASSCTASPIATQGFQRAADFYLELTAASSPSRRAEALEQRRRELDGSARCGILELPISRKHPLPVRHRRPVDRRDARRQGADPAADHGNLAAGVRNGNRRSARRSGRPSAGAVMPDAPLPDCNHEGGRNPAAFGRGVPRS